MEQTKKYRRIQVPTQDGGTLVEPAWSSLPQVVADNRAAIQQAILKSKECLLLSWPREPVATCWLPPLPTQLATITYLQILRRFRYSNCQH